MSNEKVRINSPYYPNTKKKLEKDKDGLYFMHKGQRFPVGPAYTTAGEIKPGSYVGLYPGSWITYFMF